MFPGPRWRVMVILLMWPSGPPGLTLAPSLGHLCPLPVTHHALQQHRLLGTNGCYVPFLTPVCLLTQVPSLPWPDPLPGPLQCHLLREVSPEPPPWARTSPREWAAGLPWASLGPSAFSVWSSSVYICFLTQPPEHCMPKVLTLESWKEWLFKIHV